MKKSLVVAAMLLALPGCAEQFSARVSRFQALPPLTGQSFVVQAANPQLQGGIEFGQYAQLVASRLVAQGYRPAEDPARADLVVKLAYDVDNGRERVRSSYSGFGGYGGFGGFGGFGRFGGFGSPFGFYGRRSFIYGFYDPFLFGGGGFNDVYSQTIYTSELSLQIDRTDNGQRVFEGTAKAQSGDNDLPHLVPNLVEAMFTGFPGNSGETVKITVAPETKRK
ncbi:MAG: DUF4136 domain-containing protein [Sphingomonas sp.]